MSSLFWAGTLFMLGMNIFVLTWVLRRKLLGSGIDLERLKEVSMLVSERAGEYLRANWSGNTDELPNALRGLLPIIAGIVRDHGQTVDDRTLEHLVKVSIASQRLATRTELDRAFDRLRADGQSKVA